MMIKRQTLIAAGALKLEIGVGMSAAAARVYAQSATSGVRRVGVLAPSTRAKEEVTLKAFFDEMRRVGVLAPILKGANPADIPVEQLTKLSW
jgi:hypothetical protein